MQRREELPHEAALREAEDVGAFEPFGVHDGTDVVDPLLKGRHLLEAVRAADAALVKLEHADVAADVLADAAVDLLLPCELDVGHQPRDDDHVRPRAEALVGDVEIAATRVPDV